MSKQVGKWKSKWENEQASLQTNECVGKLANKWDTEHMSWPMSKWAGEWANKLENEQMSGKMSKWAGKWSQDHDSKTWIVIWSLNCVFAAKFSTILVIIITQTTNIHFFQHQLLCMVYCRSYLIKNSLTLAQDVQQKFRLWVQNQTFLISDHH